MVNKQKLVSISSFLTITYLAFFGFIFFSSNSLGSELISDNPNLFISEEYTDNVPDGILLIGADNVWNRTAGSPEIIVAVLDTGLDATHSDLVNALWNNTDEIPNNGIDDDDNNYIDDCHGWDFVRNNNDPFNLSIYDNSKYKSSLKRHGTHVTGTIAARLNNFGVVGVAPNVSIMTLRVVNESDWNPDILVAEAIRYATNNGAQIISMSIGIYNEEITNSTSYQLVEDALQYAFSMGVHIVASAGNDYPAPVIRPANNDYVIAVGAIDSMKKIASFSCQGPEVEVVAPGVNVYSTVPGDNFGSSSGTSMAVPHVSGALALMISYDPSLTNTEARMILQQTAEDLGTSGRDDVYGFGLINLTRAIETIAAMKYTSTSTESTTLSSTNSETTPIFSSTSATIPSSTTTLETKTMYNSSSKTTNSSQINSKTTAIDGFLFYLFVLLVLPLTRLYQHRRERN
ncbi:MAG: S8 family serine peptidase [Promethearchaeota archaeon]